MKRKGFTLVELLIVVAIIGVIAAIAIPVTMGIVSQARAAETSYIVQEVQAAVDRFRNEGLSDASVYNRLSDVEDLYLSEQDIFEKKAGKGNAPGTQLQASDIVNGNINIYDSANFETVVVPLIRKEVATAVKAFTDLGVNENNFVLLDGDLDIYLVYNYLTGEVTLKTAEEMKASVAVNADGTVNVDDVYIIIGGKDLGSSGLGGSEGTGGDSGGGLPVMPNPVLPEDNLDFVGSFYMEIVDYITGKPLEGAAVTLYNGFEKLHYTTKADGVIAIAKLAYGEYTVAVEKDTYVTFYDETVYGEQYSNDIVTVTEQGYIGSSPTNRYKVRLFNANMGSIAFKSTVRKYNVSAQKWIDTFEPTTGVVTVSFAVDNSAKIGTEKAVTYENVDLTKTNGILNLFGTGGKYLAYGNYIMTVTPADSAMSVITKAVTSTVNGLDGRPTEGYSSKTSPYEYPVAMRNKATDMWGTVATLEGANQPLVGLLGKQGTWNFGKGSSPVMVTKVQLWQGSTLCYETVLSAFGRYTISGIADGTYDIYLSNAYNSKFVPNGAKQLVAQGYSSESNMTVSKSDLATGTLAFNMRHKDGSAFPMTLTITRVGETTPVFSQDLAISTKVLNVTAGFYYVTFYDGWCTGGVSAWGTVSSEGTTTLLFVRGGTTTECGRTDYEPGYVTQNIQLRPQGALTGVEFDYTFTNLTLTLHNTMQGNVAPDVVITSADIDAQGNVTKAVKLKRGTYTATLTASNCFTTQEWQFMAGSGDMAYTAGAVSTLTLKPVYNSDQSKHSLSYTAVSTTVHRASCPCGYYVDESCTFTGAVTSNVTGPDSTTHLVACSVCKINKQAQNHDFTGAYVVKTAIGSNKVGYHYRKCTQCTALGWGITKDASSACTVIATMSDSVHKYSCSLCSQMTQYSHSFTGAYVKVTDASATVSGSHARTCYGCIATGVNTAGMSVGIRGTSAACTRIVTGTTESSHATNCSVCSLTPYTAEHSYSGAYYAVTTKTATVMGTHTRDCVVCNRAAPAVACSHVLSAVDGLTHKYTCPVCKQFAVENCNQAGDYVQVATSQHYRACSKCNVGSASKAVTCTFEPQTTGSTATTHVTKCVCGRTSTANHTWGNWQASGVTLVDKTLGTHNRTCTACGYTSAAVACTPVLTGKTASQHTYKCSVCSCSLASNHTLVLEVVSAATHRYKCSKCDYVGGTVNCSFTRVAICAEANHTLKCSVDACTNTKAANHTYTYTKVTAKSSYTAVGTHKRTCSVCGYSKTENCGTTKTNNATNHINSCGLCDNSYTAAHNWGTTGLVPMSATTHARKCTVCARQEGSTQNCTFAYSSGATTSTTHNLTCTCGNQKSEEHTATTYTSSDSGCKATCTVCSKVYYLTHQYVVNSFATTSTKHSYSCSRCAYATTEAHTFSSAVVTSNTEHSATCSICKYKTVEKHSLTLTTTYHSYHLVGETVVVVMNNPYYCPPTILENFPRRCTCEGEIKSTTSFKDYYTGTYLDLTYTYFNTGAKHNTCGSILGGAKIALYCPGGYLSTCSKCNATVYAG